MMISEKEEFVENSMKDFDHNSSTVEVLKHQILK